MPIVFYEWDGVSPPPHLRTHLNVNGFLNPPPSVCRSSRRSFSQSVPITGVLNWPFFFFADNGKRREIKSRKGWWKSNRRSIDPKRSSPSLAGSNGTINCLRVQLNYRIKQIGINPFNPPPTHKLTHSHSAREFLPHVQKCSVRIERPSITTSQEVKFSHKSFVSFIEQLPSEERRRQETFHPHKLGFPLKYFATQNRGIYLFLNYWNMDHTKKGFSTLFPN